VESEEKNRKTPLYAHESVEKKTSRSSQGLALEQFFLPLDFQDWIDPGCPRPLSCKYIEKSKPRLLETHEGSATRKVKTSSKVGSPARESRFSQMVLHRPVEPTPLIEMWLFTLLPNTSPQRLPQTF